MSEKIIFLREFLNHQQDIKNILNHKASFVIAISGIIFTLSLGKMDQLPFLILAISSFFSTLLSIFIIRFPFHSKTETKFNMIGYWGFSKKSYDEYKKGIIEISKSDDKIAREYIKN